MTLGCYYLLVFAPMLLAAQNRYGNNLHSAKHLQVQDMNGKTALDLARVGKKLPCVESLEAWRWIVQKEMATEKAKKTRQVMTGE